MAKMFSFKVLNIISRYILRRIRNPRSLHRKVSNVHSSTTHTKLQRYPSFSTHYKPDFSDQTLIFDVEGALLKSSSLFPYFMLVAFEAGGLLRALLLFLLYPLICLLNEEMGLNVMVMVCFFGIKKESFRVGRAVLPKFFLEDVGEEGFEVLKRGGRRVGVSVLPRVMVDGFLREYLEVEFVVGRELKVFKGYYVGLMEDRDDDGLVLEEIIGKDKMDCHSIGIKSFNKPIDHHLFSHCKEVYMVSEADKRSWHNLPMEKYPKPLIFHDGRLAFRPTPLSTLAMFMWFPFGILLAIFRIIIALSLPYKICTPILMATGLRLKVKTPKTPLSNTSGVLYVCNHRTLLDPLYLSASLGRPSTAVTYSLSRMSEILAPIKTVRLTRDRHRDGAIMDKILSQGELVVCPEGTTCREPYLLRFSPLFAEMNAQVVPVALDAHVSMFYGTTAGGLKCLDPIFFLMNPTPSYNVEILESVSQGTAAPTCHNDADDGKSRFDVANHVQRELGKALGFECTKLTRKDKYIMLAGNEGIVNKS